jgi:hypothetical protein
MFWNFTPCSFIGVLEGRTALYSEPKRKPSEKLVIMRRESGIDPSTDRLFKFSLPLRISYQNFILILTFIVPHPHAKTKCANYETHYFVKFSALLL